MQIRPPGAPFAEQIRPAKGNESGSPSRIDRRGSQGGSFADILRKAEGRVSFSKHAGERLEQSGYPVDESKMAGLETAIDAAMEKGARSTLVLMRGLAFVVAPQTRTVITVIPNDRMRDNVFTSIDSAVVVDK